MQANKKQSRILIISIVIVLLLVLLIFVLYKLNYIPHKTYSNEDFNIAPYKSEIDKDKDGLDDQSDILLSAREYLETKPKYKSKYYASGYPDDEYGVCTDVVAYALLGAGYDLRELVNQDILEHPEEYNIDTADKNIDFRRVVNLKVFFENNAIPLTTDYQDIEAWQAGDIVVWKHHIGIISEHRNRNGVPFVLHHASPYQARYEEDVLSSSGEIIGHYRVS